MLDLPNGAGKCPVEFLAPVGEERTPRRRRLRYRWVRPDGWDAIVRLRPIILRSHGANVHSRDCNCEQACCWVLSSMLRAR